MVSIINMVTSYFQAFGKALCSLIITVLRNVALFIPAVFILNHYWQLTGVIAAQPIAEAVLSLVCLVLYMREKQFEQQSSETAQVKKTSVQRS